MTHTPSRRLPRAALLLSVALASTACGSDPDSDTRDDSDAGADGDAAVEPCTVEGVSEQIAQPSIDKVDLLLVIDNSGSMAEEQANLAAQLPRLVQALVSGDLGLDGMNNRTGEPGRDYPPVASLHLGVVSTDMGIADVADIRFCSDETYGDDGVLLTRVADSADCTGLTVPPYQEFVPPTEGTDVAELEGIACVVQVGTQGCGFEQQLEAMWKALAPKRDKSFLDGTSGHGDAANAGFLRDDAVLAVVHVSDEEDCSITEGGTEIFNPSTVDTRFANEGMNIRCALHADDPEIVRPVARYIDGLKSLKPAAYQDRIVFTAVVGVPFEADALVDGNGVQDFDGILALDAMQRTPNGPVEENTTLAQPACETENGRADPARRFVEVAKGFGENGSVRSICNNDYAGALDGLAKRVWQRLSPVCLPGALKTNEDGIVECDVVEILAKGQESSACSAARGRTFLEAREVSDGDMRTVCKLNQVAVKDGALVPAPKPIVPSSPRAGWYYDDFSDQVLECPAGAQQRIGLTAGAEAAPGAKLVLECFVPTGEGGPTCESAP